MKRSDQPHMGWKADFLLQHKSPPGASVWDFSGFSAGGLLSDVSRLKDLSR